ncbi:hypothetical protein OAR16_00285 [bacterium]|nr:hypothetical protein [bacterium]
MHLGFDINDERLNEPCSCKDSKLEVTPEDLAAATHLQFSSDCNKLEGCSIFSVTAPTPIKTAKVTTCLRQSKPVKPLAWP